jgi:uncharacterized membrane protein YphA (DoxX/SURF4 family)
MARPPCLPLVRVALPLVPFDLRWTARFAGWGYPAGMAAVVGVLEILGGLGVLVPKVRRPAAWLLIALMLRAAGTHALTAEFARVLPPLVLGGLALLLSSRSRVIRQGSRD